MSLRLPENEARRLSQELRCEDGDFLAQRRAIAGLGLLSAGIMGLIALYQLGLLKHIPEPPLPNMAADTVTASPEAYALLATPDAVLGLGSYAVTVGLAASGAKDRARSQPWIPLALTAKTLGDAFQAARLALAEWRKNKALCFWCLTAAAATFATPMLALPEARQAWRNLRSP